MNTQALFERYKALGEFPYILSLSEGEPVVFDPPAYALVQALRICEELG